MCTSAADPQKYNPPRTNTIHPSKIHKCTSAAYASKYNRSLTNTMTSSKI
jgi:hypothetical protein